MTCKGLTKKNKQCKISTKSPTGYCKRHIDQYNSDNEEDDERKNDEKENDRKYKNTAKKLLETVKKKKEINLKEIKSKEREIEKKTKELMEDVVLNKKNWEKLLSKMFKDLSKNQSQIIKLYEEKGLTLVHIRSLINIKNNTEFLIERNPEKYSTLIDMLSIYNDYIEDIRIETKERNMKIEILENTNNSIKKFNRYYINRKNYIPDINSYRTKTTDHYQCSICLGESEDGLVLDCGHKFHIECISDWFCNKLSCPTCRT